MTAARWGEVRGARWSEIDGSTWTVPAERMKAHREHKVPLCARALEILDEMRAIQNCEFIFPGRFGGAPLGEASLLPLMRRLRHKGITIHGFRSSFRDWAAEQTHYPNHVLEMALAHAIGDKVEAAYRRGDLMEKRRRLMDAWGEFCDAPPVAGGENVTPLRVIR